MSLKRIESLIKKLRDRSYQPHPARRQYIPKKSGNGLRPLGIPAADDKLVQEAVRMILESIYEPTFQSTSHGFRPGKSCHTALSQIQKTFTGVSWFVEGDIKGCFDNIDHHILVNILKRRIKDEAFIDLIWEAAPGRVSGGLDEAPDLQWHAAGLRGKSTLGEYLYERAGPVHGKAPGAIRQGATSGGSATTMSMPTTTMREPENETPKNGTP